MAGVAAAARPHGRRHARARAGERARRAAARARRGGRRGAGDPDPAARRPSCPTLGGYDLVCVTSPNGADRLLDRCCATRARSPACTVAAIGPGTARALRARGDRARRRARARPSPRGSSRRSRTCPFARALVARARRGPRRAPGRAARARRRGRRASRSTRPSPSRSTTRPRAGGGAADYLLVHVGLVGALLRRGGRRAARPAAGLDRARDERGAARRTAPSPTSRPTRTRPTG